MRAKAKGDEQTTDKQRARSKSRASPLLLALVLATSAACVSIPTEVPESLRTEESPCHPVATERSITIDCLGLSFRLPPSFEEGGDAGLVFLARSVSPPALFTIDRDSPNVIEHEPEAQETIVPADIDGVNAVVVNNASLENLAPGLEARELLVANGDRSFSVIMSTRRENLSSLWEEFMRSVRIE
jgi:hypothetical protein